MANAPGIFRAAPRDLPELRLRHQPAHRECLAIEVDTSLPGQRVVRVLDRLVERHRTPQRINLVNGPEFTGRALDAWAYQHGVAH